MTVLISRALVVALLVSVAACGGSSSSGGSAAAAPATPPETPETPEVPPEQRTSVWLNVMPPGANGNSAGGGGQGQNHPPNMTDQLFLYEELAFSPEGLKRVDEDGNCDGPNSIFEHGSADRSLFCSHFKPAFLKPTVVDSTFTVVNPNTGNTVTITRDGWGVPFVSAPTRQDGMFGVGFVGAQDRLFLHDVLRNVGRGRLSEFLGPEESFFAQDLSVLNDAGYSEEEMTELIDGTRVKFGAMGELVFDDLNQLVDGINEYLHHIGVARTGNARHPTPNPGADGTLANEKPPEYGTLVQQSEPELWKREDVVASAVLIQSTFAFGGGGETSNLRTLHALDPGLSHSNRSMSPTACRYWRDIRHANDPDTPQTDPDNAVGAVQSPAVIPEDCTAAWPAGHGVLPAGAAIWDAGSFRSRSILKRTPRGGAPVLVKRGDVPAKLPADVLPLERVLARVDQASKTLRKALKDVKAKGVEGREEKAKAVQKSVMMLAQSDPDAAIYSGSNALFGRHAMSNFIGAPASESESGYPLVVAGPQAAYFLSQLLWEVAVKTDDAGPGQLGFEARGVVFANLPYINIGRGVDFSWSATSGNSDLVDTRVSKACIMPGTNIPAPSQDDLRNNNTGGGGGDGFPDFDGYLFDDDVNDANPAVCRPIYFRTDNWESEPTGASLASGGGFATEDVTFYAMRTHYGTVIGTAQLEGEVVVISKQRSTFLASLDTTPPFALVATHAVTDADSFFDLFNATTGTFNWLYSDKRDLAWFHSGLYPKRHAQQHPELPVWGDGRFEWEGAQVDLSADPNFFSAVAARDPATGNSLDYYRNLIKIESVGNSELEGKFEFTGFLQRDEHPRVINPSSGFLHSWNNNPAAGWWAGDNKTDYGPTHRADMLKDRMQAFKDAGRKHTLATLTEIMGDAAHTDLRGMRVLPKVIRIARSTNEAEVQGLGLAQLPDLAAVTAVLDFMEEWTLDGSMDWIDPDNSDRGLGGYRRAIRATSGSTEDPALLTGAARTDQAEDVSFTYDKRPQVVFNDVLYPQLLIETLDQIVGRNAQPRAGGDSVSVQGTLDDFEQGSAFQEGWQEFLERIYGQALDEELGLDGTPGEFQKGQYNVLRCGGRFIPGGAPSSASFAVCRQKILTAINTALTCLGGFAGRADWDGTTTAEYREQGLGDCLSSQPTVEIQDQTTHTAISAQTVEPMHWTNRPTYQHAIEIQHDRDERLPNDIPD